MIDGVGYGLDQQSWGGEILFGGYSDFEHAWVTYTLANARWRSCSAIPSSFNVWTFG